MQRAKVAPSRTKNEEHEPVSQPIIEVNNLSKRYRLGQLGARSLRDEAEMLWQRWFRRNGAGRGQKSEVRDHSPTSEQTSDLRPPTSDFWALRDVSFSVQPGEVLGIIGRNGAGKSTLLKILSRITEPTEGEVIMRGRVASLLEVGTGFHPELSGCENIYLNGAILGMKKAEIDRKFDEIVDFAEVEQFIDTPVKRYSSGMYVRLAFAVAAHLDPEILIVDEVLAVGDAQFQKKCVGKMGAVAKQGRTVLFVSHNTGVLANLCTHGVLLHKGGKTCEGEIGLVINEYISSGATSGSEIVWENSAKAPGNDRVRLCSVRVVCRGGKVSDVDISEDVQLEMEYAVLKPGLPLSASFHLLDRLGMEVLASVNWASANAGRDDWAGQSFPRGVYKSTCTIPANLLNEGLYSVRAAIVSNVNTIELITDDVVKFATHDTGEMRKEYSGQWIGVVRPKLEWQTQQLSNSH